MAAHHRRWKEYMKRSGVDYSFAIALSVMLGGCAAAPDVAEKSDTKPAIIVEEITPAELSTNPAVSAAQAETARDAAIDAAGAKRGAQRKRDDAAVLKEFPQLKFTSDSERAVHYFSMGQAYSLNGETDRAIEAYRTTLVYDPTSALVRSRLAAELVKIGNLADARKECAMAIRHEPKFVDGYLLLAGIQVVSKEIDEALKTYEKALAIETANRDALLYYGTTLAEAGRLGEAVATLKRLVKLEEDPASQVDPAIAWYYLAKVETQQDKFDDAAYSLRQALKERPGFGKAALFLADIYLAQEKQDQSIKVLEEAFKESANAAVGARLAAFHLAASQFQRAVPYLETVVESDPENVSAKVRLALVYWQIQWLDKAKFTLHEIYERYPGSNEVAYYLGELELERDHPKEAVAYFEKISPEYARFEDAVLRTVASHQLMKQRDAARAHLEGAIQKKPEIVSFYTSLARLYEEENRFAQAIRFLEKNRARVVEDENALYYLGYLYDRVGNKAGGVAIMEEILKKSPENANALNYLGYTLLEEGKDLASAEAYILKAIELKPNDPYILDSFGWLLHKQGKLGAALKQLERARELKPDEGVIIEHLADIYVKLDLKRKALQA